MFYSCNECCTINDHWKATNVFRKVCLPISTYFDIVTGGERLQRNPTANSIYSKLVRAHNTLQLALCRAPVTTSVRPIILHYYTYKFTISHYDYITPCSNITDLKSSSSSSSCIASYWSISLQYKQTFKLPRRTWMSLEPFFITGLRKVISSSLSMSLFGFGFGASMLYVLQTTNVHLRSVSIYALYRQENLEIREILDRCNLQRFLK